MEKLNEEALLKCIQTAKDAGCPREQTENFISVGYIPLPWQWKFHAASRLADFDNGPVDIGLGGARGPGKSHAVLSQLALDDCKRVPGLKALFLRQTGKAAKESFDDLISKVLRGRVKYTKSGHILTIDGGSRIVLGGFDNENDIDKYIGIEYDVIIVEELNQLTEDKYNKLRGSLRTSKLNWRPRMYTSFNPGGVGHVFVRSRYVVPYRKGEEIITRFVPSTYKSNPYLNKEYIEYLESLQGDLGKAWREGEWELFAGQFFDEWRMALHVCNPFIPNTLSCVIRGGMDWGSAKPFAFYLSTIEKLTYKEQSFFRAKTFFECYGIKKRPEEWSEEIREKLRLYDLTLTDIGAVWADPSIFRKMNDMSKGIHDQFVDADERWRKMQPANNDRKNGWQVMRQWLSLAPDGMPYWQVTSNCKHLIETLPTLQHDENNVEDVDTEGEDHAGDAMRYMFKHTKWLDGRVGAAKENQGDKRAETGIFLQKNDAGQEILISLEKFTK
jgi:PBSX family phage terminase large subunit